MLLSHLFKTLAPCAARYWMEGSGIATAHCLRLTESLKCEGPPAKQAKYDRSCRAKIPAAGAGINAIKVPGMGRNGKRNPGCLRANRGRGYTAPTAFSVLRRALWKL